MSRLIGAVLLVVFFMSCSSTQFGWKEAPGQPLPGSAKYVEDFDPLTLDDDDIEVPTPAQESIVETGDAYQPVEAPNATEPLKTETVQGFRVQLLATGDEGQARESRRDAIFKFPQVDVYLTLEGSLYKLRLGDCETREQAESLRGVASRRGFRDAWIVPSLVTRKSAQETHF